MEKRKIEILENFATTKIYKDYRTLGLNRLGMSTAVAIGNFDGVHLGHQHLIQTMVSEAKALGLTPAVLTFTPNPTEFFKPLGFPGYIFNRDQKIRALHDLGVELILYQLFDRDFSMLNAFEFMDQVLIKALGAKHIVVGNDFKFAKDRTGDVDTLRDFFTPMNVNLLPLDLSQISQQPISSTMIRRNISNGQMFAALESLGHPFVIEGVVTRGRQLARNFGFPTANVELMNYVVPKFGVYSGHVVVHKSPHERGLYEFPDTIHAAAVNVGIKPTVSGSHHPILEAHLIDTKLGPDALYGSTVSVYLEQFVREEKKFSSLDELRTQIENDVKFIAHLRT